MDQHRGFFRSGQNARQFGFAAFKLDCFILQQEAGNAILDRLDEPLSSQTKCNTYNRCCHVKMHLTFA